MCGNKEILNFEKKTFQDYSAVHFNIGVQWRLEVAFFNSFNLAKFQIFNLRLLISCTSKLQLSKKSCRNSDFHWVLQYDDSLFHEVNIKSHISQKMVNNW